MHPILLAGLIINVMVIATIGGIVPLLLGAVVVGITYKLVLRDGGAADTYRASLAAFGIIYALAGFLIIKAPWSSPEIDAVTVIMELFIFAIFSALGRR